MKNALLVSFVLIGSVLGFAVAHSSTITTNIDRINVDFNRKVATISISKTVCDEIQGNVEEGTENTIECKPFGAKSDSVISNQAFDATIQTLEQMNALNLNAVMNVLKQ